MVLGRFRMVSDDFRLVTDGFGWFTVLVVT